MIMPDGEALDNIEVDDMLWELRRREMLGRPDAEVAPRMKAVEALGDVTTDRIVEAVRAGQKVIYGVDDRADLFTVNDSQVLADADATVALFARNDVVDNGDGTSTLRTTSYAVARNLCQGERFRDQVIGAFCSGYLVAPDLIATAGHCIDAAGVPDVRFVFGFRMTDATTVTTRIPTNDIYRGVELVGRAEDSAGTDWSLVRLDRPVPNRRPVRIRLAGKVAKDLPLHVIGHPSGLPAKYAPGATVRDTNPAAFFVANLDTYGGNSGSAVFGSETHRVEGTLVRGETDFVAQGPCNVSLVCPSTGCRGEDCTRTTEFAPLVPGYTLGIASHSRQVLDVRGESLAAGAEIIQWPYHGGDNQQFRLEALGDGHVRIVANHSGKVLDVTGGSTASGAAVIQWDWHGGDNQRFRLEPAGAGHVRVVAKHSGKVLDVTGASGAAGARIIQWDAHGGNNQRWRLRAAPVLARHSAMALDVRGASTAAGAELIQWTPHHQDNQLFTVESLGGGDYRIIAAHSGKVLDVSGASTASGAKVIQWDWHGGTNQRWRLEPVGSGFCRVVARHSGKVLDVSGASSGAGAAIIQWDWHGGDNQRWRLSAT
ncbi:RICIN domain-containing protein [Actinomycetospora lutea]|uniref:RICIN domain-containing protein n=1 Tax=Actinomycetospora lutea TaxID=663604 RepID=UPI002366F44F|nr:RICIN domain-containing protein [Actinomycetospora lutea]MDD7942028.1 RICIN domain-containing protein [Actinomycetospora lutea]